jgi:hypothetical protein
VLPLPLASLRVLARDTVLVLAQSLHDHAAIRAMPAEGVFDESDGQEFVGARHAMIVQHFARLLA